MEPQRAREKWGDDKKEREGGVCFSPPPPSRFFCRRPTFRALSEVHSRRSPRGKEETTRGLTLHLADGVRVLNLSEISESYKYVSAVIE